MMLKGFKARNTGSNKTILCTSQLSSDMMYLKVIVLHFKKDTRTT